MRSSLEKQMTRLYHPRHGNGRETFRLNFSEYIGKAEVVVYAILGVLLFFTALATSGIAGKMLWDGLIHRSVGSRHCGSGPTAGCTNVGRGSAYGAHLHPIAYFGYRTFPGRRPDCFDTAHPRDYPRSGQPYPGRGVVGRGAELFRASMIELGLLGLLVFILVFSITLLRRHPPAADEIDSV